MKKPDHLDALLVYVEAEQCAWTFSRRPQLGLYYIAQYANDSGLKVQVDNLSANDFVVQRIERIMLKYSCDILGLYVDQDNIWVLRRIIKSLQHLNLHLKVIIGGPQVTADPINTMQRLPEAICGAIGEGEEIFVELLSLPNLEPKNLKKCPGLVFRSDIGIEFTPARKYIEPLDRLSFPKRKELSIEGRFQFFPSMITGRGCTGRCAFCFEGRLIGPGKRLRLHSAQRCIEEFEYLAKEMKNNYICILDDTFVADTKRLKEFCKILISKHKGKLKWFCEARVDTLAKCSDLLPLMVEAGLIRLQVGGESGSQRILDIYRKDITLEQISQVVQSAPKAGLLSIFANFIIGGAFETRETFVQTRDFALNLLNAAPGCVSVGCSFYTPYPGTPMNDNPQEFGLEIIDEEVVTGIGDKHVFCKSKDLSKFEILALGQEFEKSIELRMRELSRQLPLELIERHFQANYKFGLTTEWCESLSEYLPLENYFKSIYYAKAMRFEDILNQNLDNAYPIRNVGLVSSTQNKYLIQSFRNGVLSLDELDCVLLELSAGKLTFGDIIGVINNNIPALNPQQVRQSLIERYSNLDKEFFIVWRCSPNKSKIIIH